MSPISGTFFSAPSLPPFHFAPLPFLITQSAGYATVSNHTIYLSSVARLFSFYLLCHLHAYHMYYCDCMAAMLSYGFISDESFKLLESSIVPTTLANFVGKVVTFYHAFVSLPSPLFNDGFQRTFLLQYCLANIQH